MEKDMKFSFTHIDDDIKADFAEWINRGQAVEPGQDKTWAERYEDLFRKSNGNSNYLVGQNKDRQWLMRRKEREEVRGMIKAVEESTSGSRANRQREARAGAEEVARSGRWLVMRIKTPEASAHYGAHTRWCIAGNGISLGASARQSESYARQYWNGQTSGYSKVFYYIRNDDNKFALLWQNSHKFQLWDALDNKIMQANDNGVFFASDALNEIKMFCYTVPLNPQTDNFNFREMFNNIISQGNDRLRSELTNYNRERGDNATADFTDEDYNDPNFDQLICDTIPTTSNIDLLLSRMRRTNTPLIRMKITCNTTNVIRDSLKNNNKIDLYSGGFKLKSENKSFRAVKDRFKKLAELNSDPNSGFKVVSIGYLVSFAPALNFIPYVGADNAQFIIEDQNQINTLLNNFSRYEDHALYDLFSVGINDVLTNSLAYITRYITAHPDLTTDDYNKLLGKLNEFLQYYIRMSVKANRSQLGFALPTTTIPVINEECINKIVAAYDLPEEQKETLNKILTDSTNVARITRNVERDINHIENENTGAEEVQVNQAGGVNTREVEQQLSIDDINEENRELAETLQEEVNTTPETTEVEETPQEEDDSDTWPNGVPKVIDGIEISSSEASTLGPLTEEQRRDVVLFDIIAQRENKEMTQEEYDRVLNGVIALGHDRAWLNDKIREYGITLIGSEDNEDEIDEEAVEEETVEENEDSEGIRRLSVLVQNAINDDSLSIYDDVDYTYTVEENQNIKIYLNQEDGFEKYTISFVSNRNNEGIQYGIIVKNENGEIIYNYDNVELEQDNINNIVIEIISNLAQGSEDEEDERMSEEEFNDYLNSILTYYNEIMENSLDGYSLNLPERQNFIEGDSIARKIEVYNDATEEPIGSIIVNNDRNIQFLDQEGNILESGNSEGMNTETTFNYIYEIISSANETAQENQEQSEEIQEAQETNNPQQTNDVARVMYKFYIYGLDTSRQYKIIDVTPQNTNVEDMFVVNNPTDNIAATNSEAIQKATELYDELKNNPESLNLFEIHYLKVNNETDHRLVKIIR